MLRLKKIFISNILIVLACILSSGVQAKSDNNEVKKCGVLPFDIESISDKAFPLINGMFTKSLAATVRGTIAKLASNKLKVDLVKNIPAITSTDMMPSVSFDDEYKNTLLLDLNKIAISNKYDCLIFGSLEETPLTGKGNLQLNIHVYTNGKNYTTFSGSLISLLKNKELVSKGSLKEYLISETSILSKKASSYLLTAPPSVNKAKKNENKKVASRQNVSPAPNQNNSNSDEATDILAIAKTIDPSSTLAKKDLFDEISTPLVINKNIRVEPMSLVDLYEVFYREGFYVRIPSGKNGYDPVHTPARQKAAKKLKVNINSFFKKIIYSYRKNKNNNYISCNEKKLKSFPKDKKGKEYSLCYDARYIYPKGEELRDKNREYCFNKTQNMLKIRIGKFDANHITYDSAENKIKKLRKDTGKNWRIPTIDELYILAGNIEKANPSYGMSGIGVGVKADFPYIDYNGLTNHIWSSTPVLGDLDSKWIIGAYKEIRSRISTPSGMYKIYKYEPWTYSSGNYTDYRLYNRGILFPVYTCN